MNKKSQLFTDTTDFFAIDCGDEILVDGRRYTVSGHERERRFGVEDPKFWVKRARDSETGEKKIIKLSYFESFETTFGGIKIKCFRSPDKEGNILEIVKGHPYFMQGTSHKDPKGNNIRVLDIVRGQNLFVYIDSLRMDYETYFHTILPDILKKLVKAFDAIRFLHTHGYRHGDIRNDHIIIESKTGNYVWIDFDYDYEAPENPFSLDIFGLGNILLCTVGKGFHNLYMIDSDTKTYGDLISSLEPGDFSMLDKWRLVNLRKLYPFIPKMLNDILMHFSKSADVYYELTGEIIEDVTRCLYSVFEK
ncbi:MAG: protein kinase [Desulfobacterales bacterium]|nr:protein kinase [Desulfobacterales bacterium]